MNKKKEENCNKNALPDPPQNQSINENLSFIKYTYNKIQYLSFKKYNYNKIKHPTIQNTVKTQQSTQQSLT